MESRRVFLVKINREEERNTERLQGLRVQVRQALTIPSQHFLHE